MEKILKFDVITGWSLIGLSVVLIAAAVVAAMNEGAGIGDAAAYVLRDTIGLEGNGAGVSFYTFVVGIASVLKARVVRNLLPKSGEDQS